MPKFKVTDPDSGQSLILTGDSPPTEQELHDVFAQHAAPQAAAEPQAVPLAKEPGWTYGSVLPIATDPAGGHHLALPDFVREPIQSALISGRKLEQGQVPTVSDVMPAVMATVGTGVRAPVTAAAEVAPAIASAMPKAEQKAAQLVTRAFQRDKVDPANAAQVTARYPDKELAVMDAGGTNVSRLARSVKTMPGDGSNDIERFLAERQNNQHARVLDDIATNLSDGSDLYQTTDDLIKQRSTEAGPLFKKAFAAANPNWSPRLQQFLDDPITAAAARQGVKIQRLEAVAKGEPLKASDYSFSFDDAGEPIISWAGKGEKDIPNLRTLQSVKEGLDAMVESFRDPNTHKLVLTKEGTAIKNFRDAYREELKRQAPPEYGQALDAWAGPSQSKDAIEAGQTFTKLPPEVITKRMSGLNDADKDFYRIGAARALQDVVAKAADNRDSVKAVFGNKRIRSQIEAIFGKGAVDRFAEAASAENAATSTNRAVRGGSNTADKLADAEDAGAKLKMDALKGFIAGGVKGAIAVPAIGAVTRKAQERFSGLTPEVRNALADLLTRTGPNAFDGLGSVNGSKGAVIYGANPRVNALTAQTLNALLSKPSDANRPRP